MNGSQSYRIETCSVSGKYDHYLFALDRKGVDRKRNDNVTRSCQAQVQGRLSKLDPEEVATDSVAY
jgi:hypothetical protein